MLKNQSLSLPPNELQNNLVSPVPILYIMLSKKALEYQGAIRRELNTLASLDLVNERRLATFLSNPTAQNHMVLLNGLRHFNQWLHDVTKQLQDLQALVYNYTPQTL